MKEIENMDTAPSSAGRQAEGKAAQRKRPRRTSRAQRVAYLRQWEASGQSAEAFAAGRPINAQSLYRWRMAEKPSKASGPGGREFPLREIKLGGERGLLPEGKSVTLKAPGLEATLRGYDLREVLPALAEAFGKGVSDV
jgi:hypothetical protein